MRASPPGRLPASGAEATDECLVRLACEGDTDAFSVLASRHKTWLFRFIRRYVGNDADAFDLLQDAMVAAWLSLGRFDATRPFPAWLRRIALNKCRDWHRRSVIRRIVCLLGSGDADELPADAARSDPETMWIASQSMHQLDLAIASLPRALREPLILTTFEGFSQRETSRLLRISEKAVETRIYRARQRLMQVVAKADVALLMEGATAP